MKDFIVEYLGLMLIFLAVSSYRKEDSKVNFFSIEHLTQFILVVLGVILIKS